MMDAIDKINAMQRKAEQKNQDIADARKKKWSEIQTDMPDIAALMKCIGDNFGKPSAVLVKKVNGEIVLDVGDFDPPKDLIYRSTYRNRLKR